MISMDKMQGQPPDWQDFVGITALLIINSTISFIEENNAGNAAAALMAGLAPKTKVIIGGQNQEEVPCWFLKYEYFLMVVVL